MRTLVLTTQSPVTRTSGYDVRVRHLCQETPGELHLVVVPVDPGAPGETGNDTLPEFASVRRLAGLVEGPASWRRHLRLSDAVYLRSSRPAAFAQAVQQLEALVVELGVDRVVAFGGQLGEVVRALDHPDTVVDVCDSITLTQRRLLEVTPPTGFRDRLRGRLELRRTRASEAAIARRPWVVTAISEPDSRQLRDLGGPAARVVTVPNGVDADFLAEMLPPGGVRGVAFWGNLDFGPNQEALRYFLLEVRARHLRGQEVRVRVIGAHAPAWLQELARADPDIELLGFVPDLREALAGYPVMVNAMRTGSGLKNKVLEAFGLGLAVVSTTRGIEALPSVRDGTHVRVADDAAAFAAAVSELLAEPELRHRLRRRARDLLEGEYRWSVVGEGWRALLEQTNQSDLPPSTRGEGDGSRNGDDGLRGRPVRD